MSLNRFVYYHAVIGGWAALLVWLVGELLFLDSQSLGGVVEATLIGVLAGVGIGAGLSLVSAVSSGRRLPRLSLALVPAAVVAAGGGLAGALLFSTLDRLLPMAWFARSLGWMVMGLGIGAAEGVFENSAVKIRNGLIGGAAGGFLGGLLFDPIAGSGSDMSSRAAAFVILGVAIGALIGLAHVVLKEAWLTVVDGFGAGRQLILTERVTVLGRGDHLPLPFLGYPGRDLESEHAAITRQADGRYVVQDNGSRIGTSVNGQPILAPVTLGHGDLIRMGSNIIRFERRERAAERGEVPSFGTPCGQTGKMAAPPPPPASVPPPLPSGEGPSGGVPSPQGSPPPTGDAPQADSAPRIPPPPPPPS
jgi:hypothetical protein